MKKLLFIPLLAVVALGGQMYFPANIVPASGGGAPSPVGWWKFNDGSGTTATDSSGNGNNGTLNGTNPGLPTWGTGPNANGDIVFSATSVDQYVDFGSSSLLKPTAAGTFMCWIYWTTGNGTYQPPISNGANSNDRNGCTFLFPSAKANFEVASASAVCVVAGNTTLQVNTWYHLAATWDGSTLHLYINGVEDTTGGAGQAQTCVPAPAYNLTVGWDGNHTSGSTFRSAIDDVRVYSTALTGAQIATIYAAGAQ